MHKVILPVVLVMTISMVLATAGDAYAVPSCAVPGVTSDEMWVSAEGGMLHKVDTTDGTSCSVGDFQVGGVGPALDCTDIAIDQTTLGVYGTPELYCVTFTDLYTVDQLSGDLTFVGNLKDGIVFVTSMNALEIDTAGVAYGTSFAGVLYRVDLTDGTLTNLGSLGGLYGVTLPSSGDLIFDTTTGKMFWTSTHCDFDGLGGLDPTDCPGGTDGLWLIHLIGPFPAGFGLNDPEFVADTGFLDVFAGDFVETTTNMDFVNNAGTLFELTKTGAFVNSMATVPTVNAFGGSANQILVGGIGVVMDAAALVVSGIQSSAVWMAPLAFAGVGFAAYKLRSRN